MQRVVSLIPSATEIVHALGAQDRLVGRSHECDVPASVQALPVLTAAKIDLSGSSRAIDERVRTLLQEALSVYRVFDERLRDLAPDVVLTQAQCEVCAVSLGDVEDAVCTWLDDAPDLVALEPGSLDDVWRDVQRVADALDCSERGTRLVNTLQARMEAVEQQAARAAHQPSVACIEWVDPLMVGGHWMPTLAAMAGGQPVLGTPGAPAPRITWDALRAADPDVIVVMPCGFGLERTRREATALIQQPGWNDLQAVRAGHVYLTDGNHYFNRPGPRLVESLEILAEILHPDRFPATHRGTGWVPLDSAAPESTSLSTSPVSTDAH